MHKTVDMEPTAAIRANLTVRIRVMEENIICLYSIIEPY